MKKNYSAKILVVLVLCNLFAQAQFEKASFDEKFMYDNIGFAVMQPFLKNGYESDGYWYGITGGAGQFDFGYFTGNVFRTGAPRDTGFIDNGWMARAGYRFDFSKKKMRRLSVGQFRAIPMLTINFAVAKAGGPSENIDLPLSYGFNFSPGLRIKASAINIDLRPEFNIFFGSGEENALKWFSFTPMIAVGIDGIFDVFSPKYIHERYDYMKRKTKVDTYKSERWELVYSTYLNTNVMAKVRRETTVYTYSYVPATTLYDLYLTSPFITVTPLLEYMPETHFRALTQQLGVQLNGYYGEWKFGGFWKTGQIGTASPYDRELVASNLPDLRNVSFGAEIPTQSAGGIIGFNFFQNSARRRIGKNLGYYVNYHRFYVNAMVVYNQFDRQNATYQSPLAAENEALFAQTFWSVDQKTAALNQIPEQAWGWGWGATVEMGAASASILTTYYPNAPVANYTALKFEANIPYIKLIKTMIAGRKMRKAMKEMEP